MEIITAAKFNGPLPTRKKHFRRPIMRTYTLRTLFFFFLITAGASIASAQAPPDVYWRVEDTKTNTGTYFYYYLTPGTPTIRVQVLGSFRTPGLYEIEDGTDLSRLVALAGGPAPASQIKDTRIDYSLSVVRPTSGGQQIVYEDSFERYVANTRAHPQLLDGDVLVMEMTQRQRFSWRDIASVVSTVGVLALAFERLSK